MKNKKAEKRLYNAAMVLVFLGMVFMLTTIVQMLRIAPIMGIEYALSVLAPVAFGYLFTIMGFIVLRELENKDEFNNTRY